MLPCFTTTDHAIPTVPKNDLLSLPPNIVGQRFNGVELSILIYHLKGLINMIPNKPEEMYFSFFHSILFFLKPLTPEYSYYPVIYTVAN